MKILTGKRTALLTAGVGAIGVIGAFSFAGTSALYTDNAGTQSNTITSGTVSFNNGGNTQVLHLAHNFVPGDSLTDPANNPLQRYYLNYTGTNNAFIGVDMTVTSIAAQACSDYAASTSVPVGDLASKCQGTGQQPLFGGTAVPDFNLGAYPGAIGGPTDFITPDDLKAATTCATTADDKVQCTATVANVLMPFGGAGWADASHTSLANNGDLIWAPGDHSTSPFVAITGTLDPHVGNQTQGSSTTVQLTGHAVQADNNTSNFQAGCGSTPAGPTLDPGFGAYRVLAGLYPQNMVCPGSWS